jgi:hypothetical protein
MRRRLQPVLGRECRRLHSGSGLYASSNATDAPSVFVCDENVFELELKTDDFYHITDEFEMPQTTNW